jgi:hypothetical protein
MKFKRILKIYDTFFTILCFKEQVCKRMIIRMLGFDSAKEFIMAAVIDQDIIQAKV